MQLIKLYLQLNLITSVGGVMVSMVAFQAVDPGSIPGRRSDIFYSTTKAEFVYEKYLQNVTICAPLNFILNSICYTILFLFYYNSRTAQLIELFQSEIHQNQQHRITVKQKIVYIINVLYIWILSSFNGIFEKQTVISKLNNNTITRRIVLSCVIFRKST